MRTTKTVISSVVMGVLLLALQAGADEPGELKTEKDKLSYTIGVEVAKNFKLQEVDVNQDLLVKGLKDGFAGQKLLLTEQEMRTLSQTFQAELQQRMVVKYRALATENKSKGAAFMVENRTKEGVTALPSGVQYKILKSGTGKKPADSDSVECHYRGTLINGTEFDATKPGKPATLKVAELIPGWKEVLKLMPANSKWQIFIPSNLAYGERGAGRDIGPNETLVFDLELVAVK